MFTLTMNHTVATENCSTMKPSVEKMLDVLSKILSDKYGVRIVLK